MKIMHFPGFEEKLISFTCEIDGPNCLVSAKWFDPCLKESQSRVEFMDEVDPTMVDQVKQNLRSLNEKYEVTMTDLHTDLVEWVENGQTIKRSFYGLSKYLCEQHPEIKGKVDELMIFIDDIIDKIIMISNKAAHPSR